MNGKLIYIGSIRVKKSMRTLTHRKRSEVAKESINRLCEANKMNRKIDKNLYHDSTLLGEPDLSHSGTEVELQVTSSHLNLISVETQQIIVQHEMPNVSFASSGDEDTVNFVGYVAKDEKGCRACFVLECGSSKTVLELIARKFQSRTQVILHQNMSSDQTRLSLEKEPWFHGSYLTREQSEMRLKKDGDFLVRESMLELNHFVLSVMHDGEKLHLLFDQVRTQEMVFDDISHLVKFHHDKGTPIVADNRVIYLRNGVRSPKILMR